MPSDVSHDEQIRRGFTLIELSIVLVIIGLILGGILYGRDMIRIAELRHFNKQLEEYLTAVRTFQNKYNCLPGDCDHANILWPQTPEGCHYPTGTDPGNPGLIAPQGYAQENTACNGDGNEIIDDNIDGTPSYNAYFEGYGVWQQLANAHLISGIYSGSQDQNGYWAVAGYNCPGLLSNTACPLWWDGEWLAIAGIAAGMTDNAGHLGAVMWIFPTSQTYFNNLGGAVSGLSQFTPQEAFAYDTKYDDGLPDHGNVLAQGDVLNPGCTTAGTGPVDGNGFATSPFYYDTTGITRNDDDCNFIIRSGF
jgi:prepilin-type N-terminal cleavage/methylation domain-containing protein